MHQLYQFDQTIFITIKGWFMLLVFELRLFILYFALLIFARSHLLIGTIYIVTVKIFCIKLDQIIRIKFKKSNLSQTLNQYQNYYIKTLKQILQINIFFGKSFLAFMCITFPLNCFLVTSLIFGNIPAFPAFFILTLSLQQISCHFGVHFLFAHLNKKINAPIKCFIKVYFQNKNYKLRNKIKYSYFIEAFFNRKKYGLSYYKFGQISMISFVEVWQTNVFL